MIFNKEANFAKELEVALSESRNSGKKIIVEFGGDWCIWSEKMFKVLQSSIFKKYIDKNFIFLRCYVGRDGECAYPANLELPSFTSVPFFTLLNADSEIVATQNTEVFEFFRLYNRFKLFYFFKRWSLIKG